MASKFRALLLAFVACSLLSSVSADWWSGLLAGGLGDVNNGPSVDGTGTSAVINTNENSGFAFWAGGNNLQGLLFSEPDNHVVRFCDSNGKVTTVLGAYGQSGSISEGKLSAPQGIYWDIGNDIILIANSVIGEVVSVSPEDLASFLTGGITSISMAHQASFPGFTTKQVNGDFVLVDGPYQDIQLLSNPSYNQQMPNEQVVNIFLDQMSDNPVLYVVTSTNIYQTTFSDWDYSNPQLIPLFSYWDFTTFDPTYPPNLQIISAITDFYDFYVLDAQNGAPAIVGMQSQTILLQNVCNPGNDNANPVPSDQASMCTPSALATSGNGLLFLLTTYSIRVLTSTSAPFYGPFGMSMSYNSSTNQLNLGATTTAWEGSYNNYDIIYSKNSGSDVTTINTPTVSVSVSGGDMIIAHVEGSITTNTYSTNSQLFGYKMVHLVGGDASTFQEGFGSNAAYNQANYMGYNTNTGDVFVLCPSRQVLYQITSAGELIHAAGVISNPGIDDSSEGNPYGTLNYPRGLAVDSSTGLVYTCDQKNLTRTNIRVYNPTTKKLSTLSFPGDDTFNWIWTGYIEPTTHTLYFIGAVNNGAWSYKIVKFELASPTPSPVIITSLGAAPAAFTYDNTNYFGDNVPYFWIMNTNSLDAINLLTGQKTSNVKTIPNLNGDQQHNPVVLPSKAVYFSSGYDSSIRVMPPGVDNEFYVIEPPRSFSAIINYDPKYTWENPAEFDGMAGMVVTNEGNLLATSSYMLRLYYSNPPQYAPILTAVSNTSSNTYDYSWTMPATADRSVESWIFEYVLDGVTTSSQLDLSTTSYSLPNPGNKILNSTVRAVNSFGEGPKSNSALPASPFSVGTISFTVAPSAQGYFSTDQEGSVNVTIQYSTTPTYSKVVLTSSDNTSTLAVNPIDGASIHVPLAKADHQKIWEICLIVTHNENLFNTCTPFFGVNTPPHTYKKVFNLNPTYQRSLTKTFTLPINETEGDSVEISSIVSTYGVVQIGEGVNFNYTALQYWTGDDRVNYTVCDEFGACTDSWTVIHVFSMAPNCSLDPGWKVPKGQGGVEFSMSKLHCNTTVHDKYHYFSAATSNDGKSSPSTIGGPANNSTLVLSFSPNRSGVAAWNFTVSSLGGEDYTFSASLHIQNTLPTANPYTVSWNHLTVNQVPTMNILSTSSDDDGDSLILNSLLPGKGATPSTVKQIDPLTLCYVSLNAILQGSPDGTLTLYTAIKSGSTCTIGAPINVKTFKGSMGAQFSVGDGDLDQTGATASWSTASITAS
eukprot:TRINITY_DN980_c0_g1_i4.p1 TRINITY_DN980_c0_g1~~TRINITY_DN980_c0_g1_i4.p1  ORF type:complete len:1265 (-),score=255.14 TRINITY_DN980_c0_g1_i4:175-3969(-)